MHRSSLTTAHRPHATLSGVLLSVLLLAGCSLEGCLGDAVFDESQNWRTATESALNDAIDALNNASADWQRVLADLQEELPEQVQSTVRIEVGNLVSRSVGQTGVELRCNADFVRQRVRQSLESIRTRFIGGTPSPVEPAFCQVVPLAVERESVPARIPQIEFYGYDFDQASDLRVFHERRNGVREDVTAKLDRPTHYAMTLKFGPTGVQLDNLSERFSLEWGGRQISSIGIIQPETPVCRTRTDPFEPAEITFMPTDHKRGDREFGGHGPTVRATVTLLPEPEALKARVFMRAYESNADDSPRSDFTTVEGAHTYRLYTPPSGWRIDRVSGELSTSVGYRDSGHADDRFNMGSGGPIKRFVFVGDTGGDEAGTRTKADITFNRLNIELVETGGCVTDRAIMNLRDLNLINATTFRRLENAARLNLGNRTLDLDRETP